MLGDQPLREDLVVVPIAQQDLRHTGGVRVGHDVLNKHRVWARRRPIRVAIVESPPASPALVLLGVAHPSTIGRYGPAMATRTRVISSCDLCGKQPAPHHHRLGVDAPVRGIDLCDKHDGQFTKALKPFVEATYPVGPLPTPAKTRKRRTT